MLSRAVLRASDSRRASVTLLALSCLTAADSTCKLFLLEFYNEGKLRTCDENDLQILSICLCLLSLAFCLLSHSSLFLSISLPLSLSLCLPPFALSPCHAMANTPTTSHEDAFSIICEAGHSNFPKLSRRLDLQFAQLVHETTCSSHGILMNLCRFVSSSVNPFSNPRPKRVDEFHVERHPRQSQDTKSQGNAGRHAVLRT